LGPLAVLRAVDEGELPSVRAGDLDGGVDPALLDRHPEGAAGRQLGVEGLGLARRKLAGDGSSRSERARWGRAGRGGGGGEAPRGARRGQRLDRHGGVGPFGGPTLPEMGEEAPSGGPSGETLPLSLA